MRQRCGRIHRGSGARVALHRAALHTQRRLGALAKLETMPSDAATRSSTSPGGLQLTEVPLVVPAAGVFTVRAGIKQGLTRKELRAPGLHRPLHGVRSTTPVESMPARCRAVLAIAPAGTVISHVTAARLHDLWLSRVDDDSIHVIRPAGTSRIRRPGITDHEGLNRRSLGVVHGIPVTSAADTWADLNGVITPGNLVCVGDGIANADGGLEALAAALSWRVSRRAPGVGSLRLVQARVRKGSRSRLESMGRVVLVNGGLPEPLLNYAVKDAAGEGLAEVDLAWPDWRTCVELQSKKFHQGREVVDESRRQLLTDAGWFVGFMFPETTFTELKARAFVDHMRGQLILRGWKP